VITLKSQNISITKINFQVASHQHICQLESKNNIIISKQVYE
jgi:hypothetical protein